MPSLTSLNCPACGKPISPGTKFCASCGQELVQPETGAPRDPLIGQFVGGRFLVQNKLGEGGMGAVYQAEQVAMKRPVALKVLHPHLCQDPELIERFHREAAAASRLNHPNTITVHDFGQTDEGTLYIAMEFVDGRSLADEIATISNLPWTRPVHVALQIAESLADAHAAGIVHRDLKPDNVMLVSRAGSTDFVKILDFGIAKIADAAEGVADKRKALTKTGMIFGTPQYMSPEQIRGQGVDHRTDIYALGVILYQMLTGSLPFTAENPMGMLTKHLMEPPRPMAHARPGLSVPQELEALVMRCLEKDPAGRFQSMAEAVPMLAALAGDTRPGFAVQTPAPVSHVAPQLQTQGFGVGPPPTAVLEATPPQVLGTAAMGGFAGQSTPGMGGFAGQSTPGMGGFAGQSTPGMGGFAGQSTPGMGAFAAQSSPGVGVFGGQVTGGLTPGPVAGAKRGGGGRTVLLVVLILLLLGGASVGGVVAWRVLAEDRAEPDAGTVASIGPHTTPTFPTLPPVPYPPPEVPPPPDPPVAPTSPDAGVAAPADAGVAEPADAAVPVASCKVAAAPGSRAEELVEALGERESQIRLCLNPLLSKNFEGEIHLSYRWGKGRGPERFEATKNTLGDKALAVCVETVVKMARHPSSKTTSKGQLSLEAAGRDGQLVACAATAGVPARRPGKKTGPKPTTWPAGVPYPYGYPPGGYPGY